MTASSKKTLIIKTLGVLATIALFTLSPFLADRLFSSYGQQQKVLVPDSPYTTLDQVRFLPENQWLDMDQARQITNVDTSKKMDVWLKAEITNEQNIEYWTIANTFTWFEQFQIFVLYPDKMEVRVLGGNFNHLYPHASFRIKKRRES